MIHITVYAGPSLDPQDGRDPSVMSYDEGDGPVDEILRRIGLEYKTADYFPHRQVVITIDPVADPLPDALAIGSAVRAASYALQQTGLLDD